MKSNEMQMMFQRAYMDLSNGVIDPFDREVLSYSPLPDSVIDPYVNQHVDPLQTMNFTNNALNLWIEESHKTSYFTEHFVTLSRMIMNGVTTMARGLVTLHMRGEDLEQAPLSVQDLIGISSYQFRKSYLGVIQTIKSYPEISERLLMNQLRWNNTLIKLFKTKEKLEKPAPVAGIQDPGADGRKSNETHEDCAASCGISLPASSEPGISELSAFSEPGAYSALRAFSSFDNRENCKDGKSVSGSSLSAYSADPEENQKDTEIFGNASAASGGPEAVHETRKTPDEAYSDKLPEEITADPTDSVEGDDAISEPEETGITDDPETEDRLLNESEQTDPAEVRESASPDSCRGMICSDEFYDFEDWICKSTPIPVSGIAASCRMPDTS